ncbi:MAG TPA: hypothetical protein VLB12_09150 [Gemmatimonadales bacterium]|nr:hypothetical protein [Gemmatimonadales bacterium]
MARSRPRFAVPLFLTLGTVGTAPGYMIGVSDHQLISIYDTGTGDYPIIRVVEIKRAGRGKGP